MKTETEQALDIILDEINVKRLTFRVTENVSLVYDGDWYLLQDGKRHELLYGNKEKIRVMQLIKM